MYRVLLLSHGNLARELLRTVEMVIGAQPEEAVRAVSLETGQDMDEYYQVIDRFVAGSADRGGCMIFTDIAGGSPFITSARVYREHSPRMKLEIITGMNLPMVIEAVSNRIYGDFEAVKEEAVREGVGGIRAFSDSMPVC